MIAARPIGSFAFLVCLAMPALSHADTVFTDGTLDLSDYTDPFTISSGPMTDSMSQCSSCGNPGDALSTVFTLTTNTSATSNLEVGLLNKNFTYRTSTEGAIASIDITTKRRCSVVREMGVSSTCQQGPSPRMISSGSILLRELKFRVRTPISRARRWSSASSMPTARSPFLRSLRPSFTTIWCSMLLKRLSPEVWSL
jgi:hypothetical protein